MKRFLLMMSIVLMVFLSACGSSGKDGGKNTPDIAPKSDAAAIPEGSISFEILNSSNGDIYELFVAKAESEEFGADLLKESILKNGETAAVYINFAEYVRYYDIKALREDGEYYTWLNVPLGDKPSKVTLSLSTEDGPQFTTE